MGLEQVHFADRQGRNLGNAEAAVEPQQENHAFQRRGVLVEQDQLVQRVNTGVCTSFFCSPGTSLSAVTSMSSKSSGFRQE